MSLKNKYVFIFLAGIFFTIYGYADQTEGQTNSQGIINLHREYKAKLIEYRDVVDTLDGWERYLCKIKTELKEMDDEYRNVSDRAFCFGDLYEWNRFNKSWSELDREVKKTHLMVEKCKNSVTYYKQQMEEAFQKRNDAIMHMIKSITFLSRT